MKGWIFFFLIMNTWKTEVMVDVDYVYPIYIIICSAIFRIYGIAVLTQVTYTLYVLINLEKVHALFTECKIQVQHSHMRMGMSIIKRKLNSWTTKQLPPMTNLLLLVTDHWFCLSYYEAETYQKTNENLCLL